MISEEITIILPTKNHENFILENLNYLDSYLKRSFTKYQLLIISNGSNKKNINLLKNYKKINFEHLVYEQSGKGFAVREGLKKSSYKYALICDSDFSVDIKYIEKFFKNGNPLSGFVIGSRKLNTSVVEKTPLIRLLSGSIFTFLTKNFLKINISDTQCGFKLIDKSKFTNCQQFISNDFFYDVELFLLAKKTYINIQEVPVEYIHNKESSIKIFSDSFKMFLNLVSIKKKYR